MENSHQHDKEPSPCSVYLPSHCNSLPESLVNLPSEYLTVTETSQTQDLEEENNQSQIFLSDIAANNQKEDFYKKNLKEKDDLLAISLSVLNYQPSVDHSAADKDQSPDFHAVSPPVTEESQQYGHHSPLVGKFTYAYTLSNPIVALSGQKYQHQITTGLSTRLHTPNKGIVSNVANLPTNNSYLFIWCV